MVGLRRRWRRAWLTGALAGMLAALALWGMGTRRVPRGGEEPVVAVWHAAEQRVVWLPIEEYVQGVVAAEMPSHFHLEALKAQAVAARTYVLRRMAENGRLEGGAHVSSAAQVHQAWMSREEFLARWGTAEGAERWRRIGEAVAATRGLVLTYQGQLAEALYHASSGGHTEDAASYFQAHVPYLVGVPDPYSRQAPGDQTWAAFPLAVVLERLGVDVQATEGSGGRGLESMAGVAAAAGAADGGPGNAVVAVLSRTATGRAAEVAVAGRVYSGRQVREALGLRSTWFDVSVAGDVVVFQVRGYGHGVGMSQYGADGMARAGYTFEQILAHYYRGTTLERWY